MNWAWLKSKTLWTNVIGIILVVATYFYTDQAVIAQIEVALVAILNLVLRLAFGEAPGTIIIPKTIPELVQAVSESSEIVTSDAAKALAAAAKVEKVNAAQK